MPTARSAAAMTHTTSFRLAVVRANHSRSASSDGGKRVSRVRVTSGRLNHSQKSGRSSSCGGRNVTRSPLSTGPSTSFSGGIRVLLAYLMRALLPITMRWLSSGGGEDAALALGIDSGRAACVHSLLLSPQRTSPLPLVRRRHHPSGRSDRQSDRRARLPSRTGGGRTAECDLRQ